VRQSSIIIYSQMFDFGTENKTSAKYLTMPYCLHTVYCN
jgi:hypothetical protein